MQSPTVTLVADDITERWNLLAPCVADRRRSVM